MDPDKVMDFLNSRDRFAQHCGIRLTQVLPGKAEAELAVTEELFNGRDLVQGGAMVTLADFAFAAAANTVGEMAVTQNCSVHFLRPGSGKLLRASAVIDHAGRKTAVGTVRVTDETGQLVLLMTATGFVIGGTPAAGKAEK